MKLKRTYKLWKDREQVVFDIITIELIIKLVTNFYNDLTIDENCRYRSWEYCYSHFVKVRGNKEINYDYLSLQLAFYLASWGMYRGSSFLLQKDYKIYIPVVKELLNEKYDALVGIRCEDLKKKNNQKLLQEITSFLNIYYDGIRHKVKETKIKNKLSDTLITKILLETIGCVPAYDRYFVGGVKNQKVAIGNYSINSILQLVNFYEHHEEQLEKIRMKMKIEDIPYLQMKILDMGFWQIGFNLDMKKKTNNTN